MRKIAVLNYKGGTGKTTLVVHLAHALAMSGKKVLLVDTDPQGACGYYLGIQSPITLYDVLMGTTTLSEAKVSARPHLDLILGSERLVAAELKLGALKGRETVLRQKFGAFNQVDYVLFDCAPSMSLINQNVLLFANEVFVPVCLDYLSLMGVRQLLKNLDILRKLFGHSIHITKVIPTMVGRKTAHQTAILETLGRVFPTQLSQAMIRHSPKLSEESGHQQTVFEGRPKSPVAADFNLLKDEVLL